MPLAVDPPFSLTTFKFSKLEYFALSELTPASATQKGSAMSSFGNILRNLGFNRTAAGAAPPEASPTEISVVDVEGKLEGLAASKPQELDWKVSIVDLLKLLDLDNSFEARKELAIELEIPAEKMDDSAQMNTWLHQIVLQKLAENGGNIPKELLD